MPEPGLGSAALKQELLGELRRHGIVVWLDKDAAYSAFVDALQRQAAANPFLYPVVAFRGSFLQTVLALEPYGNSLDKSPLLIHMPGFNEESIRRTPVLELYEAGYRFRKSLDTLVQEVAHGRVTPAELQELLGQPPDSARRRCLAGPAPQRVARRAGGAARADEPWSGRR